MPRELPTGDFVASDFVATDVPFTDVAPTDFAARDFGVPESAALDDFLLVDAFAFGVREDLADELFLCFAPAVATACSGDTLIALIPATSSAMRMVLRVFIGLRNSWPHCSKNAARNLPNILRELLAAGSIIYF